MLVYGRLYLFVRTRQKVTFRRESRTLSIAISLISVSVAVRAPPAEGGRGQRPYPALHGGKVGAMPVRTVNALKCRIVLAPLISARCRKAPQSRGPSQAPGKTIPSSPESDGPRPLRQCCIFGRGLPVWAARFKAPYPAEPSSRRASGDGPSATNSSDRETIVPDQNRLYASLRPLWGGMPRPGVEPKPGP